MAYLPACQGRRLVEWRYVVPVQPPRGRPQSVRPMHPCTGPRLRAPGGGSVVQFSIRGSEPVRATPSRVPVPRGMARPLVAVGRASARLASPVRVGWQGLPRRPQGPSMAPGCPLDPSIAARAVRRSAIAGSARLGPGTSLLDASASKNGACHSVRQEWCIYHDRAGQARPSPSNPRRSAETLARAGPPFCGG